MKESECKKKLLEIEGKFKGKTDEEMCKLMSETYREVKIATENEKSPKKINELSRRLSFIRWSAIPSKSIICKSNFDYYIENKKNEYKQETDEDFLKFAKGKKLMVVANLPYYITTAILLKILEETHTVDKMIVMMQKEVAQRICGKPSTKDYNALSVLLQYFTNPKIVLDVKPSSFYPQPTVDSSVVEIKYKTEMDNTALNLNYFLKFNRNIFSQRRKTLINNLQKTYHYTKSEIEEILYHFHISVSIRAEELSVNQIIDLANAFYKHFEQNKRTN